MENHAIQLYNYHKWANSRFFERLKELPNEIYTNEIKSVFSSISDVIGHIYRTDGLYLSVMSGDPFEKTMQVIEKLGKKAINKNLQHMQDLYVEMSRKYQTFFDSLDDLEAPLTVNHPKYGSIETSVPELVRHIVNHGTYHRGNITAMLRQQEHAGVPTDYLFYLYEIA